MHPRYRVTHATAGLGSTLFPFGRPHPVSTYRLGGTDGKFDGASDHLDQMPISSQEVSVLSTQLSGPGRARRVFLAGCAVAVALGLLPLPSPASGSSDTYQDAASGVHAPAIAALKTAGILEGTDCGHNRFCPTEPLPRRVMAVWIARAVDSQEPTTTTTVPSFTDVDNEVWWAPHVERLARLRVTFGCSIDPLRYCPEEPVTRAQMAGFLARAFGLEASGRAGFADIAGNTHASNIDAVATVRITAGCATGPIRYCPRSHVTRAQMATFLARALKLVDLPEASALLPVGSALDDTALDGVKHIVYARSDQHVWLVQANGTLFDSYPCERQSRLASTRPISDIFQVPTCLGFLRWHNDGTHGAVPAAARQTRDRFPFHPRLSQRNPDADRGGTRPVPLGGLCPPAERQGRTALRMGTDRNPRLRSRLTPMKSEDDSDAEPRPSSTSPAATTQTAASDYRTSPHTEVPATALVSHALVARADRPLPPAVSVPTGRILDNHPPLRFVGKARTVGKRLEEQTAGVSET